MGSKELRCDKLWNGGDNSDTNNGKSYHITAPFKVFQWQKPGISGTLDDLPSVPPAFL